MSDDAEEFGAEMPTVPSADPSLPGSIELGAFSVSLSVADLAASRSFYEHLGFVVTGGDPDGGWQIMKNGESTIGLFQGMFEGNILTFNPGLTNRMELLESFTDVRDIESRLDDAGIELAQRVDADNADGPGSIVLTDPDGNVIMLDQHVPRPR